jgi:outer membrane protein assembly factor BamB
MNDPSLEMQRHAMDSWQVVKNRIGPILLSFLLVFAVAAIITYIMPRKYRGQVKMKIERQADKVKLDPTAGGGLFALDLATGKALWSAPAVSCAGRERCSPAQTAAVTAIPGVVFSGSMSGVMRAFESDTGKELWSYDSVRDYKTVNGAAGRGGAIDQSGVVVVDGWVYMNSGYAQWGAQPGNVLLAFKVAK